MPDYERYYGWVFPEGTDSVANDAGRQRINTLLDAADSSLKTADDNYDSLTSRHTPCGRWGRTTSKSLSSGAAPVALDGTHSAIFDHSGSDFDVNTSNGQITFNTNGFYLVTFKFLLTDSSGASEGWFRVGLADASAPGTLLNGTVKTVPLEVYAGTTIVHGTFPVYARASGGPIFYATPYTFSAQQANLTFGTTYSVYGGADYSNFSIEYKRSV